MSAIEIPHPLSALVNTNDGRATQIFREYLQGLNGFQPATVANLPEPIAGYVCYVSDTIDGGRPCYADGAVWRRFDNNAVVA